MNMADINSIVNSDSTNNIFVYSYTTSYPT
jgi:hypothetical protein